MIDAAADLQKLTAAIDHQESRINTLESAKALIERDLSTLQQTNQSITSENVLIQERNINLIANNKQLSQAEAVNIQSIAALSARQNELLIELASAKKDLRSSQDLVENLQRLNTQLTKDEEFRKNEHSNCIASLTKIQDGVLTERNNEVAERNVLELERVRLLKETWKRHQDLAKASIREICQRHTVEYIEKVSFKGDPDNTLHICGEFVVLDAKSPGSDDLRNFPTYLKDQAEKAKKYAKQENVKSDVFFVVPTNTLDYLETFVYRHGDHNVYIISVDALEPVILCLKKIEEYEFAEQLSPEDRESIYRVLGRFAHLSKRRIQVDIFFAYNYPLRLFLKILSVHQY